MSNIIKYTIEAYDEIMPRTKLKRRYVEIEVVAFSEKLALSKAMRMVDRGYYIVIAAKDSSL